MNIVRAEWDLRGVWMVLPLFSKLYLTVLLGIAIATVVSVIKILIQLHRSQRYRSGLGENPSTMGGSDLTDRVTFLLQLHLFALFLFGVCLADHCFTVVRTIRASSSFLREEGVDPLGPLIGFVFVVFLVLLVLHSLQWFAYLQVQSAEARGHRANLAER